MKIKIFFIAATISIGIFLGGKVNACTYGIDSECSPGEICNSAGVCEKGDTNAGRQKCTFGIDTTCSPGWVCGSDEYCTVKSTSIPSAITCASKSGTCQTSSDCGTGKKADSSATCPPNQTCCVSSTATTTTPATNGIYIPTNTGLADSSVQAILENLLRWLLGIVGIIALIGFVISGIQYVVSTGDEGMMDTAKRNMLYSIIGVVVALAGFVIIQAIDFALRAKSF